MNGFLNQFPYSDFHEMNLDWIIRTVKALESEMKDFKAINQMTFEGTWDITKQYKPYSIVFDYDSGYSYLSKRPVPSGVPISDPDYWFIVGPLIIDSQARTSIEHILRFITNNYESGSIATAVRYAGDYVIANGELYKVTQTINIGEDYTEGYNVESTTVENMIKENVVPDKYIFIGDSFNADNHYSWGKKIVAKLGLTLGTDAWVVAVPGGGMGNGLILPDVQTLANSMSSATKNSITKIVMVFGSNDWNQTEANIANGLAALENYLVSNFPYAEISLVAAQWGYLNETYRQGLLTAYNIYADTVKRIKFVDKQFILMLDPYFVETDMVHPTDQCTSIMARSLISIMQGGTGWTKYYSALKAGFDTTGFGGNLNNYTLYGDITPAGTHVWINDRNGIQFTNNITITRAGVQIGIMDCSAPANRHLNNLFQREAEIPVLGFIRTPSNTYHVIKATLVVTKRSNDHIWDLYIKNDTVINGSFDVPVAGLYLGFNVYLDYTRT